MIALYGRISPRCDCQLRGRGAAIGATAPLECADQGGFPNGQTRIPRSVRHARIDTLAGKRIGFVSNEQWQAFRMLPLLRDLLKADFPTAELLPIDAYPQGNVLIPTEETAALVKKSGVDAVIVGNAA